MPDTSAGPVFFSTRYRFTPGVRTGETATISDGSGNPLFTYRSFASVTGIVAALVAGIVLVSGIAASAFLFAEKRPAAAGASLFLTLAFASVIAALVPRVRVTLYDAAGKPILKVRQQNRAPLPGTRFAVRGADGHTAATVHRSAFSRILAHRWRIDAPPDQNGVAFAAEDSLRGALVRKVAGKFERKYQTNIRIIHNGIEAAKIVRRPDDRGEYDYLDIDPSASLDRRVALALAVLVFGMEP